MVLREMGRKSGLIGKTHIAPKEVYPFNVWPEGTPVPMALFSNEYMRDNLKDFFAQIGDAAFYLHAASGYPHRTKGNFDSSVHADEFEGSDVEYDPLSVEVPAYLPDTKEVRQDLADYFRFVTRFDSFVGTVLEELEVAGRLDDTLIVLLSDHGMPFPGAKASPFEAGHKCPLIVAHPRGVGAGNTCSALVNWTDILPTVLDAMETPESMRPKGFTGTSLMPLLTEPDAAWSDLTFYSHAFHEVTNYFPYRVARGRRYKYVRCLASQLPMPLGTDLFDSASYKSILQTGGSAVRPLDRLAYHWPEALFDLEEDPYETVNLIDDPEFASIVGDYRSRLTELRLETQDPWLEVDFQEGRLPGYR